MKGVILGAGKIARGFIGHLLYLSGIPFSFIEKAESLVDQINEQGQYTVNILGNSEKNCVVKGANAIGFHDENQVTEVIADADVVFTAVGGKNLISLIPYLAKAIEKKAKKGGNLNIITCENWKLPATILRNGIDEMISEEVKEYLKNQVGITEAVIMRSAIEADEEMLKEDPLIVNVQDYWELPVDASRIAGELPPIQGLKLIHEFSGFLERKFYTYNAANGTTSYLGALLGYKFLADAAHDKRIVSILDNVYKETAQALSQKHHFPLEEQMAFTLTSKRKLQDYTIVDFIERNARDPLRKLGKEDRLVGSASLVQECGIRPDNLCIAIAAAIFYTNPEDESAAELERMRKEEGIDTVLKNVCQLDPNGELGMMIKEKIALLKEWGWIHE